ncbi:MAG: DUF4270 family protein, partial [Sphingobacterium sp.]
PIALGACLFIASCNKDMAISLDNDNIDNLNVIEDDTLSATVSTVQMPDIPTSASGTILVGKTTQPLSGSLKSSSSFRLSPASISGELPTSAVFDSINLVLRPNWKRYTYGDTTKSQKIVAHRLTQRLETKTIDNSLNGKASPIYIPGPAIFGDQEFNYAEEALGSVTFLPHMNKKDSISMRLSDVIGNEFFNKIKKSDVAFNSAENFNEYFYGITLVPDEANTAMVGFSDTLEVKINYSYTGDDGFKKKGSKSLVMGQKAFQYNHYDADRSGTAFENLSTTKEISSSSTNGKVFIQGGTGVAAKLSFPALKDFVQQPDLAINKAELEIELDNTHFGPFTAAPTPALFIGDSNVPTSFVMIPFIPGEIQVGTYYLSNSTGKNGRYVFNLIEYIKSIEDTDQVDKTLLLSLSSEKLFDMSNVLFTTVNTTNLATEKNKPKVKLNIVYTKFK